MLWHLRKKNVLSSLQPSQGFARCGMPTSETATPGMEETRATDPVQGTEQGRPENIDVSVCQCALEYELCSAYSQLFAMRPRTCPWGMIMGILCCLIR